MNGSKSTCGESTCTGQRTGFRASGFRSVRLSLGFRDHRRHFQRLLFWSDGLAVCAEQELSG